MFENGIDMDVSKLYPPVEFPVSRGTPMISPLIRWEHSENWWEFSLKQNQIFFINLFTFGTSCFNNLNFISGLSQNLRVKSQIEAVKGTLF
jgi:hypothetical protein